MWLRMWDTSFIRVMCFENLAEEVNYFLVPLLLSHLFFITHLQKKLELETSWASPSLRAFNQLLKMNNLGLFAILLTTLCCLILASSPFSLFPTEHIQFTLLPRPLTTKRSTDSSFLVGNLWRQEPTYFLNLCRGLNQAGANSFHLKGLDLEVRWQILASCWCAGGLQLYRLVSWAAAALQAG